jgi:hypothetical protein
MQSIHIHAINIRVLFTIHFDANEISIHELGTIFVFEYLALHYMAPVTSAIADGYDDRNISSLGFFPRLMAPGPPMHRIGSVLLQIKTRTLAQAIHLF